MKKIILFLVISVMCVSVYAQTVVEVETLKVTDLGNQKLCAAKVNGCIDYYYIMLKTSNIYQKYITVYLGDKEEAIRLLQFLYDLNSKSGTYINLENRTDNVVSWNRLGYYTVFSEGRVLKGHIRKQNIKGFIAELNQ
jgi:hypothetical protein